MTCFYKGVIKSATLLLVFPLFCCTEKPEKAHASVFPDDQWQTRRPKEVGIDSVKLHEALDYLASESGEDGLEEVFITRYGYNFYRGDSIYKKHNIYSSSKSFTSTVLGLLRDKGVVSEETFAKEIDSGMLRLYPKVQLRHFASMTSGYNAVGTSRWGENSEDWSPTPYQISDPLFPPGTEYAYWDEAQMMFGRLLTKASGKSLKSIFRKSIGDKIGIGDFDWWEDENSQDIPQNNGCSGVKINAEQLARFGHFFLNGGRWKRQQLLSKEWVQQATQNQVFTDKVADTDRDNVDGRGCYGFNWWVNGITPSGEYHMPNAPKSLFYASGLHNNMCFVIPEWNMVFVRRGEDGNPAKGKSFVYNEFFRRLALAVKMP